MIRERVSAGLARAKARGKRLGRPKTEAGREAASLGPLKQAVGILKTAKQQGIGAPVVRRIKAGLSEAA